MQITIVGFKGTGKTTVFNALTGLKADVFGGSPTDKVLGNIKVPDERFDALVQHCKPKKLTPAEITIVDLAAVAPDSAGKGFSSVMLSEMRAADAMVQVVRAFDNPALPSSPDPLAEVQNLQSELCLADYMVVEKKLERIYKENRKDNERTLLEKVKEHLEEERPLRLLDLDEQSWKNLAGYGFLSRKPLLILINQPEEKAADVPDEGLKKFAEEFDCRLLTISAAVEMELNDLDEEERKDFLADLGLESSARNRFIRSCYDMLNLISFFTAGEPEVWQLSITKGISAQKAAGKIHSDIERGFIRAEVIDWKDYVAYPTEAKCKEAGKMHLEGKNYVMQDGDVCYFRFNV